MKTLSIVLMMSFLSSQLTGLKIIRGRVTDKSTHLGIERVLVMVQGTKIRTFTGKQGKFTLSVPAVSSELTFTAAGYEPKVVRLEKQSDLQVELSQIVALDEVAVVSRPSPKVFMSPSPAAYALRGRAGSGTYQSSPPAYLANESYTHHEENKFLDVRTNPLSTFSADVDAASYSNVRRFINMGQIPPKDAVRSEELINYFSYHYPEPEKGEPIGFHVEIAPAPWNTDHQLLKIGMKAQSIAKDKLPPSNLVFLIDVSGSMDSPERLPLIQSAMKMLTDQLRSIDKVSIVAYAGNAGLVLPSTSGDEKQRIKQAIDMLSAGGSTAGGEGIKLAYSIAREHFIHGGNNRVILSTDGDFNVGVNSEAELMQIIEEERKSGVFLSILGVGMGNYKDSKMQALANKGNGNHAYLDNLNEARKVLVHEFGGTLFNVAKDVKLQVEFNPAHVRGYRLIGYEKRLLANEDFNDDKKDAGDVGAGQTVTALYEIIPTGVPSEFLRGVDGLKYQQPLKAYTIPSAEWATIKYRYKLPHGETSVMRFLPVMPHDRKASDKLSCDFVFASSVAELGMLLHNSEFRQHSSYEQVLELARRGKGSDTEGYRAEYISLVQSLMLLKELPM